MPSGQDQPPITVADLDSKVVEFDSAIRLNPDDANAYRNRGLVLGRKREYDRALSDFDKALSINPNDARAHALRGLVWERKGETKRAIADYDRAMELDPANAGTYRAHRERVLGNGIVTKPSDRGDVPARGRGFNLLLNPFVLLDVQPSASAQTVKQAAEDALEDGIAPAEAIQRAQQILLTPRLRIDAEVSGFLDVEPELASRVIAKLKREANKKELMDDLTSLHALPRSNVLAHLGSAFPIGASELFQLLETQAILAPGAVLDAVNEARLEAGSGKVDRDTIADALTRLEELQTKAVIDSLIENGGFAESFTAFVKRVLESRDPTLIAKLDTYIRAYAQAAASELSLRREQVVVACDALRTDPKKPESIDRVTTSLHHWNEIGKPLQLFEANMNREEPHARDLYIHVRDLCIWLANERSEYEIAETITQACADVFSNLPRSMAMMREESEQLTKLRNQQTVIALLTPLSSLCEEAQNNHRDLEKEVLRSGFNSRSQGIAKNLFDEFARAVSAVTGSDLADVPWRLIRDIAISLNNDSKSASAARAVIDGLVDHFNVQRPSKELAEALEQDRKAARKNVAQAELEKSVAAGRMAEAGPIVERLLALETDPDELAALKRMRDTITSKQQSNKLKVWGWVGAAAFLAIVIFANQDNRSSYSPSPSYQPPPVSPPSSQLPSTYRPPTGAPSSQPQPTPPAPTLYTEDRPTVGTDLQFTQSNIRYCTFQDVRLEAARSFANGEIERAAFNALINDWNSRCSSYRYRNSDKSIVDAEATSRRTLLQAEGRAIAGTWQVRQPPRPSAPVASDPAPVFSKAGLTIDTRNGQRRLTIEMATTPQQWAWGTSFRTSMPLDAGMLYLYPEPRRSSNTMKTALFSLDVLFINQNGQIAEIFERRAALSTDVVTPKAPARAMLELNAGTVARLGIKVGDMVRTVAVNESSSSAR